MIKKFLSISIIIIGLLGLLSGCYSPPVDNDTPPSFYEETSSPDLDSGIRAEPLPPATEDMGEPEHLPYYGENVHIQLL